MSHYIEERPWGKFEVLLDSNECKVKKITVNPGQRLSLQSHKKRSEHWILTEGSMRITVNDKVFDCSVGDHVFIPKEAKHRMQNISTTSSALIEVQSGDYFGEDDIIRYEDDYNRV